jgi:hypothetical protein
MMAGLPDISGVYNGVFIAIETKMPEAGDPTPIQQLRHAQIREAGGHVTVARSVREAVVWADGVAYPPRRRKTSVRRSQAG